MTKNSRELGISGELKAGEYLEGDGYEILERNYRCRFGEIDIIASKSNTLFFIEVKTRTTGSFLSPEESVDYFKLEHIKNCANHYIQKNNMEEYDLSFDVISIISSRTGVSLRHIRNCEI